MLMQKMKGFFGQGFGTGTLRDDLSAGVTKANDSVTGGVIQVIHAFGQRKAQP